MITTRGPTKVFLHYPRVVIVYVNGDIRAIPTSRCKIVLTDAGAKVYERADSEAERHAA